MSTALPTLRGHRCPRLAPLWAALLAVSTSAGCQRARPAGDAETSRAGAAALAAVAVYASQYSTYEARTETVVRDGAAWRAAWQRMQSGPDPRPLPRVDFGRHMIVLVAAGEQPSGGWEVQIDTVYAEAAGALVRYTVVAPGAGCLSPQVITAPVAAVRVTRRAGVVRFEGRTVRRAC